MKKSVFCVGVIIFTVFLAINIYAVAICQNIEITNQNWKKHPSIVEIRKIYKEIKNSLTDKTFTYIEKDFSLLSRDCRGVYPIEKMGLGYDNDDNVRFYLFSQRISDDDLQSMEYYYDKKGRLRFLLITVESNVFAKIEKRIYVSSSGKVFWDVMTEAGKITYGEVVNDPWEIRSYSSNGIKELVENTQVKCKEY